MPRPPSSAVARVSHTPTVRGQCNVIPSSDSAPRADSHADVGHRQHPVSDVTMRERAAAVRVEREDVALGRQPVCVTVDRPDIGV